MPSLNRTVRWVIAGGVLVMVAYAAVHVTLQTYLDANHVEERINEALTRSTEGRYRVDVGAVEWSLWHRALQADRVTLRPDSQALRRTSAAVGDRPTLRGHGSARSVRLEGIHLWPLFWHRSLRVNTIALQRPRVHLDVGDDAQQTTDRTRATASTSRSAHGVHAALARRLPEIAVRQVRVDSGAVSLRRRDGPPVDTLWGLSIQADDVRIDSSAAQDTSRMLFSNDIAMAFDGYRRIFSDSLYVFALGATRASTRDASLVMDSIRVAPPMSDRAFMQRVGHRTNRFHSAARRVALRGFDYRRFIEARSLRVETAQIDSLVVDVYRNNHLPPGPEGGPPPMLHEAFQSIQRAIRIDTIHVSDGHIRYAKLDEDATEPGAISFEEVDASIRNVTNDPRRMTQSTPAVVEATTQVAGAGRLQTTIRLPLLAPHLALSYRGRLGPMDVRAFNDAFVHLAGIRVESGHVDSLSFEAAVQNGRATGTLQGMYRALEVETLDQATGERGLKKRIETFVLDRLAIESQNTREDGTARTGTIEHTHQEGDSFFKFLWLSVRSGLFSLIGL